MKLSSHYKILRVATYQGEVPPAPGAMPIPADHVRLYHWTRVPPGVTEERVAENIMQEGLDIKKARGSTYGEPNVVWGSTKVPNRGKVFVEFSVHKDDPRWGIGKPRTTGDVEWLHKSGADVTFQDSIRPEDILTVHLPWHDTYRYLKDHDMFSRVIDGEFDYLLDKPESNEAKAITYIKNHPSI
jgi:hypothetical protein